MDVSHKVLDKHVEILTKKGEEGLYKFCLGQGIMKSLSDKNPELEILDLSERFLGEGRLSGNKKLFIIARILRRVAHTIYRQFLKLNKSKTKNQRFLNVV